MKTRTVAYATHATRPMTVISGGSHHRSVRRVLAAICARPADASVVDDTSESPHLLRCRRHTLEERTAPCRSDLTERTTGVTGQPCQVGNFDQAETRFTR